MGLMDLADRTWPVLGRMVGLHTRLYRLTGGRVGGRFPGGAPVLLLDHTGARSGERRTTPLLYTSDGADLVIVASKGGHPKNPAWYHNLMAHPDTRVQVGSEVREVRARQAREDERARLWDLADAVYPTYADYRARATREIPIVVLQPRPR